MSACRSFTTALSLGLLLASAAAAQPEPPTPEERRVQRWTSPTLTRFRSEEEFRRYLRDLQQAAPVHPPVPVEALPPPPPPAPPPPSVPGDVTVSGSRIARPSLESASPVTVLTQSSVSPANPAITNVQEVGVDEGDIVKQVGRFLLVLQDARIFSVDTRPEGGPGLALADRIDVYGDPGDDTWYDEMLVFGDRVIVTGYNYGEDATQFTVLRVDPAGRLRHQGTFFLSSNDYFDDENYATRLVGDRLVIYSPIALQDVDLDEKWEWPVVRRWQAEEDRSPPAPGRPVLDARSIYRPVAHFDDPVIHTLSICRLEEAPAGAEGLACESRGFVGPNSRQMYVTPTDAWLWTWSESYDWDIDDTCPADFRPRPDQAQPAYLYRLPMSGRRPSVAGVRGEPIDQLSLAAIGDSFHALTRSESTSCRQSAETPLTFVSLPLTRLRRRLAEAPVRVYTPLPSVGGERVENRFTDAHLVYGARSGWRSDAPAAELAKGGRVGVVPVDSPESARILAVPHSVIRVERLGNDAVVTGYRNDDGLDLSYVRIGPVPRIASTITAAGRYESEGRSHAFNSSMAADGTGLFGLPTVPKVMESGRLVYRSDGSDLSFFGLDGRGGISPLGQLERSGRPPSPDYRCEVSCVDWYGNSRPIFTGGRVFALSGTEVVEGQVEDGRIREIRRLDMTRPPPAR